MPELRSRANYHHGDLRDALIATGLDLTRTGGPKALRLREVARHIGVSPNAAYRHFANHNALLAAVAADVQDRMAQNMRSQMDPSEAQDASAHAIARLRGVGLGYVGFAIEEPGWFQLAFFAPEGIERPDGQIPPPLMLLHEALDALVDADVLTASRRAGAEWSCWSTVHGFAELIIHGPLKSVPSEQKRALATRAIDDIITGVLTPARE